MKIEINETQLLDDVVGELERLGYKEDYRSNSSDFKVVCSWGIGVFSIYENDFYTPSHNEIYTLTQLKEMK